jgi:hypothetical protein
MFPIIGPEMAAALLGSSNEAEESIQKLKPRRRPHRIRFKVILSAFCRRVGNSINLPTERELRACLRQHIYWVIRKEKSSD